MSTSRDWFPTTRENQLSMAFTWNTALANSGTAWNIPASVQGELSPLTSAAESALSQAKDESTRTPVVTTQCREAFKALEDKMRDIKKRYFYVPPLTDADLVRLGLKIPDSTPTPSGTPTAQVGQKTYGFLSRSLRLAANSTQTPRQYMAGVLRNKTPKLSGVSRIARHELGVKIVYVTGSATDPANKGYRIWYTVVAPGETPPANPDDLHKSFLTKRKKDVIEFDFGDSGKTAFFAVQIENGSKKGPWGPLMNALIP